MASDSSTTFLAVDIECFGDAFDAHIPAVGFAVGHVWKDAHRAEIVETRLFKIAAPSAEIVPEPRCQVEFWDKHPGLLAELQKDALPLCVVGPQIYAYVQSVYKQFGPRVEIRSDNPEFDLGRLNFLLYQCGASKVPIRYDTSNPDQPPRYVRIQDIGSQMSVLKAESRKDLKSGAPRATHSPDIDALRILYLSLMLTVSMSLEASTDVDLLIPPKCQHAFQK